MIIILAGIVAGTQSKGAVEDVGVILVDMAQDIFNAISSSHNSLRIANSRVLDVFVSQELKRAPPQLSLER